MKKKKKKVSDFLFSERIWAEGFSFSLVSRPSVKRMPKLMVSEGFFLQRSVLQVLIFLLRIQEPHPSESLLSVFRTLMGGEMFRVLVIEILLIDFKIQSHSSGSKLVWVNRRWLPFGILPICGLGLAAIDFHTSIPSTPDLHGLGTRVSFPFLVMKKKRKKIKHNWCGYCSLYLLLKVLVAFFDPGALITKTKRNTCRFKLFYQRWPLFRLSLFVDHHGDSGKFNPMTFTQAKVLQLRFQIRITSGLTEFIPSFGFNSVDYSGFTGRVGSCKETGVTKLSTHVDFKSTTAAPRWGRSGQLAFIQGVYYSLHNFHRVARKSPNLSDGPGRPSPWISCRALFVFWDNFTDDFQTGLDLMFRWRIVVGRLNQEGTFRDHLSTQKRQWGAIEYNWFRIATFSHWRELQELFLANSFGSWFAGKCFVYRYPDGSFKFVGDSSLSRGVDRSTWFFPSSTGSDWKEDSVAFIFEHLLLIPRVIWSVRRDACLCRDLSDLSYFHTVTSTFGIGLGIWSIVQAQWVIHESLAIVQGWELVWYSVGYAFYVNYGVFSFFVCLVVNYSRSSLVGSVLRLTSLVVRPSTRDGYWGSLRWWLLFFNLSTTTTGVWGLRISPGFGFAGYGWIFSPTYNSIGRLLLWVAGRIGPFQLVHGLCFISRGVTVHKLELTKEKKRNYYGKWSYVLGEGGFRSEGKQVFYSVNLQFCSCSFNCCSVTTCHK